MAKYGVTTMSAIARSDRWDAKYHIALSENKGRVEALIERHDRDSLNDMMSKIGYSPAAWEVICRGSKPKSQWPGIIPRTYSDEEAALYIILSTFDDAITDELQRLLTEVSTVEAKIAARDAISAQLGEIA
tara:strand:+ start:149815 stop:150207 length:393 start_codon:yes stop_codon:yes gene_type:complete